MKEELMTIMDKLQRADTPTYLVMLALCCVMGQSIKEEPAGCTRGDFKRAIRALRGIQEVAPQEVEDTVKMIRREWLHRDGA